MQKNLITLSNRIDEAGFSRRLGVYKTIIDEVLATQAIELQLKTAENYGTYPKVAVDAFLDVLLRGGKRIRGALAMVAYEMFGGTDTKMISEAAGALEIMNTYILLADDIQDRSTMRRGGKTAHIILKDYHEAHSLGGDSQHFGEAIAIDALLIAQHFAMNIFAGLNVDPATKILAIQNFNNCFMTTMHGQTLDIFNEVVGHVSEDDLMNVLGWKTAYYTFINPLQFGAILAGATKKDLDGLADFGLNAGRTFQITDDILGIFNNQTETGKSPLDDIKEGKRTILTVYALDHAAAADAEFLKKSLGNQQLTNAEFKECIRIISQSGARDNAQAVAQNSAEKAIKVLTNNKKWDKNTKLFLRELVQYLLVRNH